VFSLRHSAPKLPTDFALFFFIRRNEKKIHVHVCVRWHLFFFFFLPIFSCWLGGGV
jgi:hypothetical protein